MCRGLPMVRGHLNLDGQRHLVVGTVNAEHTVDLDRGCALGKDFTFNAIRPENDVGVFFALQNFLMHLLVTHPITAMAAGGIKYYFATDVAGRWVVVHPPPFKIKTSVYRVEGVSKGKPDCSLHRKKLKRYFCCLSQTADGRQDQHYWKNPDNRSRHCVDDVKPLIAAR